jgi:hypothetical protein
MRNAARKFPPKNNRAGPSDGSAQGDLANEIDIAFLDLWLGISQLRELVHEDRNGRPPKHGKVRGKAA